MTATRQSQWPDLRTGTTLQCISDTHFGAAGNGAWLLAWMDRARDDMIKIGPYTCHGRVDTGDCIHWDVGDAQPTQDAWYMAWRDAIIRGNPTLPFALTGGNHDYDSFDATDATANRSAYQWAKDVQWAPGANNVVRIGGVWVLMFSPPLLANGTNGWYLDAATLDWMDRTIAELAPDPVWIANHCPPVAQYTGAGNMYNIDNANPDLFPMLGSHDNVPGLIHGHIHVVPTNANFAKVIDVGGRNMFSVNLPPCGGGRPGSVAYADHQYNGGLLMSTYITHDGNSIVVRVRDHLRQAWTPLSDGTYTQTVTLP